jgi:hypothetical protein
MLDRIQRRLDHNPSGVAEAIAHRVTNRNEHGYEGVILWRKTHDHSEDGFEYVVHHFFARKTDWQAIFETGDYFFNREEAEAKYEDRVRKGY